MPDSVGILISFKSLCYRTKLDDKIITSNNMSFIKQKYQLIKRSACINSPSSFQTTRI